jgi:FMN phosphatase YigB (HAD superfamily)
MTEDIGGMTPIEAVLFDFGGTLDADGTRWAARLHAGYREAGGSLDLPTFEPLFRQSDQRLARRREIRRLGLRDTIALQCRLLAELLPDGLHVPWPEVVGRFCSDAVQVARRNDGLLSRLAQRWRLAVVSNFTGNLRPCLEELGLVRHFDVLIDSALEGREKPDPHPFLAALAALGASPSASWMIGDNPEADIRPALLLGLSACWLVEPDRPTPRGLAPTARITRLPEVEQALEAACTG